jgi:ribonuclease Z
VAKLIILGSANAVPDETHENTHMAIRGQERTILIDCVSNPIVRLSQAGVVLDQVTDLILTHFHPDHVSGVPLLLMDMWLLGRKLPLIIHGLDYTLDRMEKLMEYYDWETWPHFFPVKFHRVRDQEMAPVLEYEDLRIFASPVRHLVPNIGLRVESMKSMKTLAYSSDTQPCPEVVRLAAGADILIHESAGASLGHSSAEQAGRIAQEAEAGFLYLIHYPTRAFDPERLVPEAAKNYNGSVALAKDFMELDF